MVALVLASRPNNHNNAAVVESLLTSTGQVSHSFLCFNGAMALKGSTKGLIAKYSLQRFELNAAVMSISVSLMAVSEC